MDYLNEPGNCPRPQDNTQREAIVIMGEPLKRNGRILAHLQPHRGAVRNSKVNGKETRGINDYLIYSLGFLAGQEFKRIEIIERNMRAKIYPR